MTSIEEAVMDFRIEYGILFCLWFVNCNRVTLHGYKKLIDACYAVFFISFNLDTQSGILYNNLVCEST